MSMFYDSDDPETRRVRRMIAADYSDADDDDAFSEFGDDYDDAEDGGGKRTRDDDDDGGEGMDFDNDESMVDPALREHDENGDDLYDNLHLAAGFRGRSNKKKKKKNRGGTGTREQEPSEEVKILLGQANQAYATGDLDEAERILAEVIRIDNQVYAAWKTLGEIHKQRGDIPKCLLAWISAGHLRLKDSELWSICGKLSFQIGQIDQALYCYNRAILGNSQDVEAIFERGLVFKEMGSYGKVYAASICSCIKNTDKDMLGS